MKPNMNTKINKIKATDEKISCQRLTFRSVFCFHIVSFISLLFLIEHYQEAANTGLFCFCTKLKK